MRFAQAGRAENPDLAAALWRQTQEANALKGYEMQAAAQEQTNYMNAGVGLAGAAPKGTFQNAWDTLNQPSEEGMLSDFSAAGSGTEALGGEALASGITGDLATAGMGSEALTAEGLMAGFGEGGGALGTALGGGETALGAEALMSGMVAPAATTAATGAAAGGATAAAGGGSAALAGMGPMGWAALLALGMGLFG